MNYFYLLYENIENSSEESVLNFNYWETQRNNTQKSYELQAKSFKSFLNKNDIVIDYGSGFGMSKNYFFDFNYIDFEPYPQNSREIPSFTNASLLLKQYSGKAAGVVCNLVLNVIDNVEDRKIAVENILRLLKPNGIAYIVTRTPQQVEDAKTKIPYGDGYKIKSKSGFTFQKGFTNGELKSYIFNVSSNLEGEFKVESGIGVSGNSSVKVTRIK
jgi:SAM-dependent methyltransferase